MPKKRHWAKYTKPPTTVPHSLESSGLQSNLHHEDPQSPRGVNDLLAKLRRASLAATAAASSASGGDGAGNDDFAALSGGSSLAGQGGRGGEGDGGPFGGLPAISAVVHPTVPPEIAQLFFAPGPGGTGFVPGNATGGRGGGSVQIAGAGGGAGGGRGRGYLPPPGPAPPPSWLSQSRHAPRPSTRGAVEARRSGRWPRSMQSGRMMPGLSMPERGSLVDIVLCKMAHDWDFQKQYNRYDLPYLHSHLRSALVSYLSELGGPERGLSISDLRCLLLPQQLPRPLPLPHAKADNARIDGDSGDDDGDDYDDDDLPSPSTLNEDFRFLDLTASIGQSISLKELGDLLFPAAAAAAAAAAKAKTAAQESWEDAASAALAVPRPLLPSLTHLSLAQDPFSQMTPFRQQMVSWRQLLSFAQHLPRLTHLSLAYWPEPTLTPNAARYAAVVSHQWGRVQYGGTGFYSHTLDNDWAEAVMLVKRLSAALYGLEYLDLTGCASWFPALMTRVDHDEVDWVGCWGKVTTLVLSFGGNSSGGGGQPETEGGVLSSATRPDQPPRLQQGRVARQVNAVSDAILVERHIQKQRAGKGRFITVIEDRSKLSR